MQKYHGVVQDASGRAIGGAEVRVLLADTQTPAVIYDDNGGIITQPILADGYGRHAFRAANGYYDIVATYGGRTAALRAVRISDGSTLTGTLGIHHYQIAFLESNLQGYVTRPPEPHYVPGFSTQVITP